MECATTHCSRPAWSRGWCNTHYWDGLQSFGPKTLLDSWFERFTIELHPSLGSCWRWTGTIDTKGYGHLGARGKLKAHRVTWELLVGPIPEGLTIDHLCQNTRCVNPAHMEPVTNGENTRRKWERRR